MRPREQIGECRGEACTSQCDQMKEEMTGIGHIDNLQNVEVARTQKDSGESSSALSSDEDFAFPSPTRTWCAGLNDAERDRKKSHPIER